MQQRIFVLVFLAGGPDGDTIANPCRQLLHEQLARHVCGAGCPLVDRLVRSRVLPWAAPRPPGPGWEVGRGRGGGRVSELAAMAAWEGGRRGSGCRWWPATSCWPVCGRPRDSSQAGKHAAIAKACKPAITTLTGGTSGRLSWIVPKTATFQYSAVASGMIKHSGRLADTSR